MLAIKIKVWFQYRYVQKAGGDEHFRGTNTLRWAFSGMAWINLQLGQEAARGILMAFMRHRSAKYERRSSLLKGGAKIVDLKARLSRAVKQSKNRFDYLKELKDSEYYNLLKVYTRLQRQKAKKKHASKNLGILENLDVRGPVMAKYLKLYCAKLKCEYLLDFHVRAYALT